MSDISDISDPDIRNVRNVRKVTELMTQAACSAMGLADVPNPAQFNTTAR